MYKDGQKFGQINNLKLYVPWKTILTDSKDITKLCASQLILKISENLYNTYIYFLT